MKKITIIFILLLFNTIPSQIKAESIYNKIINKYIKLNNYRKIKRSYPTKRGTILVTPDKMKNILPLGHAAIVYNKYYVYEATNKGVVRGYNNWKNTKKKVFGLQVINTTNKHSNNVLKYIRKQVRKKYNYLFFNTKTRKKFYCSQLIWAAYYDKYRINLDTNLFGNAARIGAIHPMELVLSKKTKVIYFYEKR